MALPKPETQIETTTVDATDLDLREALGVVRRHEARIVVSDDGEPAGALVSMADLRAVQQLDAKRREAQAMRKRLSEQFADYPRDELEADILATIEEVERESRGY